MKKRNTEYEYPNYPIIGKLNTRESGNLYQREIDLRREEVKEALLGVPFGCISPYSKVPILKLFCVPYSKEEKLSRWRLERVLSDLPVQSIGARWDEPIFLKFENKLEQPEFRRTFHMDFFIEVLIPFLLSSSKFDIVVKCMQTCKLLYLRIRDKVCKNAIEKFGFYGTPIYYCSRVPKQYLDWQSVGYVNHLNMRQQSQDQRLAIEAERKFANKRVDFNTFLEHNGYSYLKLDDWEDPENRFIFDRFVNQFACDFFRWYRESNDWSPEFLKSLTERLYNKRLRIPFSGSFLSGLAYLSRNDKHLFYCYYTGKYKTPKDIRIGEDTIAVFCFGKKLSFINVSSQDARECKTQILQHVGEGIVKYINMQKGNRFAIVTEYIFDVVY
jgi:hypothetical protein